MFFQIIHIPKSKQIVEVEYVLKTNSIIVKCIILKNVKYLKEEINMEVGKYHI